ncbi:MAG TPA: PaaI family thioesterase [bacterium]|nr:PaaI family thioesterase [bacterium]
MTGTEFSVRDPDYERRVRESFAAQSFMATLGAEIVALGPGRCDIRMAYAPGLLQQDGFLHAGALATIADSAAGYAAYTLMESGDRVLSVEFKINLVRPAAGEAAVARARVVKPGRTITPCTAEVFAVRDGHETLCAVAQLTMIRIPPDGS